MTDTQMIQSFVLVEQLAILGVNTACIASGSRSTPVTLALANHPDIETFAFVDERGAAFFALGRAKLTGKPIVVVCTSGTAGANFLPAISEAKEVGIPLIVITADRPHELRISGANQTMDQVKLYGDKVNWFVDMGLVPADTATRYAQFVALQAYQNAIYPQMGAVHINMPLRKPLQPESDSSLKELRDQVRQSMRPLDLHVPKGGVTDDLELYLDTLLLSHSKPLLILGPEADRYLGSNALDGLSLPVLADPTSGFRYNGEVIPNYDLMLRLDRFDSPDIVIQIGEMPVSKYLTDFLQQYAGSWVVCSPLPKLTDGVLGSSHIVKTDPRRVVAALSKLTRFDSSWVDGLRVTSQKLMDNTDTILDTYGGYEAVAIRKLVDILNPGRLWIANSLAVRHFDEFIYKLGKSTGISSARGVSGIDGTLSSALGTASVEPTLLVTGDLAFYHDLNALLIMQRYKLPLLVVIINNGGGAIFDRLPISDFEAFDEFFYQKHTLNFDRVAEQFGIDYLKIESPDEIRTHGESIEEMATRQRGIVEIVTDGRAQEKLRKEIIAKLSELSE
ncbi:MAG: 2-succinyl-5-enolpyruvyl-6-hydroxy-3-cyclohexene-1-carboxylic-acid synthase [Candidatus Kariarchaeaceae archaeon]|jgi:2-succinyl-5-enolpyruvyl-6-hydroxy-3-cyclohexene-1-carboxylate synthase